MFVIDKEDGYFTVEAAILFPFVIFIMLAMAYVLIFSYDRALLAGDAMSVLEVACEVGIKDEEKLKERLSEELNLYKKEHPYIFAKNLAMEVETKPYYITVSLSLEPDMPVIKGITKFLNMPTQIEYKNSVFVVDPSRVMLLVEDMEGALQEEDD